MIPLLSNGASNTNGLYNLILHLNPLLIRLQLAQFIWYHSLQNTYDLLINIGEPVVLFANGVFFIGIPFLECCFNLEDCKLFTIGVKDWPGLVLLGLNGQCRFFERCK